ncbi:MAG: hypothetical protein GWP14_09580 [Actinobacteria bacterium]|nr:hypothetical protein [Actinomycetota bacterium]
MNVRKMKIMAICAHPGDAFDDSGGTLCHHAERGDEVIVVLLTNGARSHAALFTDEKRKAKGQRDEKKANMTVEQIEQVKADEIIAAGKELGITDIRFMHEEDDILLVKEETILKVADLIREEKPDILVTHHPEQEGGLLTTHPIVGQIVMLGYEAAGARWTRDETLPPHQISQVFFIGQVNAKAWSLAHVYHPHWYVYVDIEDVVDRKIKALDHLKSQRYEGILARKRIEVADGWIGTRVDVSYAERFIPMIPEVYKYFPIEQSTLDKPKGWTDRVHAVSKFVTHKVPFEGKQIL